MPPKCRVVVASTPRATGHEECLSSLHWKVPCWPGSENSKCAEVSEVRLAGALVITCAVDAASFVKETESTAGAIGGGSHEALFTE
jgi:hypothetical protein